MISSFTSFAKDLLQENDKPSYGCLMAMVSPDLSGQFIEWSFDNIDPEDTAPDGYEREPHITVLYGFHPDVTHEEVFTIVRNCKPLKITLGKVTKFKHDDQDVLKVDIESQDLRDLNALIIKSFVDRYTNKYPEYHPHMTLAYVKKGAAEDIDPEVFEGFEMVIDDLVYSYPEESKKVHIKLVEQPEEPIVKEDTSKKHTYEVKDVFVNGKRYTGHVVTTSEGSALAKIVFRNLSKDQQNNPQPHILTAKQIGGYKIIDRGVFSTPAATTISDPWQDILY